MLLGNKLISGADDHIVRIHNTLTWQCERIITHHKDEVWSLLTYNG